MDKRFLLFDGEKSLSLWEDGEHWTYFSGLPKSTQIEQYAKVAAAFRMYNLFAETVSSVPFSLVDMKSKEEVDGSANWDNKVGYLPNPAELFRLNALSYLATNTIYNLRTSDAIGYRTKGLYHAIPASFVPVTNPITNELEHIERWLGATREKFSPKDKRLVRMWRLDHTTEVLPSEHTVAQAIMSAAGEVYYADLWIQNYYRRGGIAPTAIAMKGLIFKGKQEDEEKSWTDWLKGLGRFTHRVVRFFNADAMDIKQFGSSVTDLKNNEVYRQALENIAMGGGAPLSLLLSNSANLATATVEERQWYKNTITPFIRWMDYEYNEQVFHPDGYHLLHNTSTLDAQQEEDAINVETAGKLLDLLAKCETFDLFVSIAESYLEVSDKVLKAAKKYYDAKEKRAEEARIQVQQTPPAQPVQAQPEPVAPPSANGKNPPETLTKWIPSLDELKELKVWRDVASRKFRKAESLDFIYQPHYGGLPAKVQGEIIARLPAADSLETIKEIFEMEQYIETTTPAPAYAVDDIKLLADALNRLSTITEQPKAPEPVQVVVNNITHKRRGKLTSTFVSHAFATEGAANGTDTAA